MTEARQTGHSEHGAGDAEHEASAPAASTETSGGTSSAAGAPAGATPAGASTAGEPTTGEPTTGEPTDAATAASENRPTGKTTGLWGTRGEGADEPHSPVDGPAAGGPASDSEDLADEEDRAYRKELRKGLLLGLGGGVLVGLVVALLLGAFVWPGYLTGPGSPDDTAQKATTALAGKDAPGLDAVSCHNRSGQATTQIPAQALQLIGRATSTGPTTQTLDNEARTPVDLVVSSGGQTQTLPTDLVLSVNDGSWCLNGLAQRQ